MVEDCAFSLFRNTKANSSREEYPALKFLIKNKRFMIHYCLLIFEVTLLSCLFKLSFGIYRRYVDNTFALFKNALQVNILTSNLLLMSK